MTEYTFLSEILLLVH